MVIANDEESRELNRRFRTRVAPFIRNHAASLDHEAAERILAQFTPDARELLEVPGFSEDPLHEDDADIHPFPDVVHKYPNKILYLTTDECPVYCRYCTRKRRTLLSRGHAQTPIGSILEYLRSHPEVNEIIFSGGDPLMLRPADLLQRSREFLTLPGVHYLRYHTRALTTSPGLCNENLFEALALLRSKHADRHLHFVLHINLAQEISEITRALVRRLNDLGIRCYAQTVLLRGINDNASVLAALSSELLQAGIQPYYLHMLDRVVGSAHFEVGDAQALQIYEELKALIPVYALPKLVRDSKQGKKPL